MNIIKKIYSKVFYEVDRYGYYMFNYYDLSIELGCRKNNLKRSIDRLIDKTPYIIVNDLVKEKYGVYTIVRK